MKLTCPCCGAYGTLHMFSADRDARHCVALAAKLPPQLEPPLFDYLALFQPPARVLTWRRVRRLLGELVAAIEAGQIERRGRAWSAGVPAWQAALQYMVDKRESLTLPLKSHGYLYEVLIGGVDRAEAADEEATEQQRRQDSRKRAAPLAAPMETPEELMARRRRELAAAVDSAVKRA